MKKIILAILFLFILSPLASAGITISEQPSEALCQCDSTVYKMILTNDGNVAKTFQLSVVGDKVAWVSLAPSSLKLDAGKSAKFYAFITPKCYASPGNYSFTIKATAGGTVYEKKITLIVKNCHTFELSAPDSLDVCINEAAKFDVAIKNTGKFKDIFDITTSGASADIDSLMLGHGQSHDINLDFAGKAAPGTYEVKLTATNRKIPSIKREVLTSVVVKTCADFEYSFKAPDKVCLGDVMSFEIKVKNIGDSKDSYTISAPTGVTLENASFALDVNKSITIRATYRPKLNETKIKLVISTGSGLKKEFNVPIKVERCASFMIVTAKNETFCVGDDIKYSVSIKNTGPVEDGYNLIVNIGNLTDTRLTAKPGKMNSTTLVLTGLKEGEHLVNITVRTDSGLERTQTNKLVVERCCDISVITTPDTIELCAGSIAGVSTMLGIKSVGKDNYTILVDQPWLVPESRTFSTSVKEETKLIRLRIKTPKKAGRYVANINVFSGRCSDKAHVILNVKSCFGFELDSYEKNITLCPGEEKRDEIRITNTGNCKDEFLLASTADWLLIGNTTNKTMFMNKDETKNIGIRIVADKITNESKTAEIIIQSRYDPTVKEMVRYDISLLNKSECYGVDLSTEKELTIEQCSNKVIGLNITNTGLVKDTFNLSVHDGAAKWVLIEPSEIELGPNETKTSYMVIRMPADVEVNDYFINVTAASDMSSDTETIKIIAQNYTDE